MSKKARAWRDILLLLRCSLFCLAWLCGGLTLAASPADVARGYAAAEVEQAFRNPADDALPWTLWYWMKGRASPEGITADLQAMKQAGLGGAYLMPIQAPDDPPAFNPPATQLSPRYWQMVRHASKEAERFGLQLGVHLCDGFATAGGPWITPELSMQQLVWSSARVNAGDDGPLRLPEPASHEGYYRDVAVLAFPSPPGDGVSTVTVHPRVSTSTDEPNAQRLSDSSNSERFRSAEPCWIEYAFDEPFTCRAITVVPDGRNYQCQRLVVLASDDGRNYRQVAQLTPPRHGWQEEGRAVTHAIPATTARWFRFAWDPAGSEPGDEDLDNAKWSPVLKVNSIQLSSQATIPNYRGKSAAVWRVAPWATDAELPEADCVPLESILDLTDKLDSSGNLNWRPTAGEWTVLRLGHTSTGRQNATAGGGMGLECDKLNPAAVRLQYQSWFGETRRQMVQRLGAEGAERVLTTLHLDSWECGSQNWTPGFREHFERLRGYAPTRWLPAMTGVPIASADASERFLHDVRTTIADLLAESFWSTLAALAKRDGVRFTAECTAPTMPGDALRHFAYVDAPMGEFWLNSPTHDKPNDMLDAISAAHVYGKRVIQAEAFTQLRIGWDESPRTLKALGDYHLALGANRTVLHVFTHNPWLDRQPGQTLGGVGLYFQRDQPWLAASRGWMRYLARCHAVLQAGRPVADIAVWTGDELPSRAVSPERLMNDLPGLFGEKAIEFEERRVENAGQPTREQPVGVRASAGIVESSHWVDPLRGYAYDSINSDALLRLAKVENGLIVLPGGASYAVLVLPGRSPMMPTASRMSPEIAEKLAELVEQGAQVLCCEPLTASPSQTGGSAADARVSRAAARMQAVSSRCHRGPWTDATLDRLGLARDLEVHSATMTTSSIAWGHRAGVGWDAYYVSNQSDASQGVTLSFRATRRTVEVWDPVSGEIRHAGDSQLADGRTDVRATFAPQQSLLFVLRDDASPAKPSPAIRVPSQPLKGPWRLSFVSAVGDNPGAIENAILGDLSQHDDPLMRHFAGQAVYETSFDWSGVESGARAWLEVESVEPLAKVTLNGVDCGVLWTAPWRIEITDALRPGANLLKLTVASTWKNRLIADKKLPESEQLTWTSAPVQLAHQELTPFGLIGPVRIITEPR